jgi:gephyrin
MTSSYKTPSALYKMLDVSEALGIILNETSPLPIETVPLHLAHGRILADTILAADPVPAYRASIKDGYAVVSSDGPGEYSVAFDVHAGMQSNQQQHLSPGSIAYIATGGPVPPGADAVVQIEDTEFIVPSNIDTSSNKTHQQKRVRIKTQASPGQDIRQIGSDMAQGDPVLLPGQHLGPAEIGILATVGVSKDIKVYSKPRVAVLSTGDEVCEPDAAVLAPGQVRDANRAMLLAAAQSAGAAAATTTDLGIARDSAEVVEAALDRAIELGVDILLTTGGVSMGERDFIKPLLEKRGQVFFGKICMKPGKPLTFAKIDTSSTPSTSTPPTSIHLPAISTATSADNNKRRSSLLVFGLPGNPVSSIVTFNLAVIPSMRKMEGWKDPHLRRVHVETAMPITMDPVRPEYHRAVVRWGRRQKDGEMGWVAHSTGGQISSRLLSSKSANMLLEIPKKEGVLPAGSIVTALIVGDLRCVAE